jgi:hypothetical protein
MTLVATSSSLGSDNVPTTTKYNASAATYDYCGTTYADASKRCQTPCFSNSDCDNNEKCYAQCTNCTVDPTPPPTPVPPPTPQLQPLIMKGCPTEHPPGTIDRDFAAPKKAKQTQI